MNKIVENKVQCNTCKGVLISESETIPVTCYCGNVTVLGGTVSLIRKGKKEIIEGIDYKEMSKFLLLEIA